LHGKSAQPFFSLVIEQFTRVEKCKTLIGWRWRGERRPKWLSAKATDSINEFFSLLLGLLILKKAKSLIMNSSAQRRDNAE
jgi:hypothetical protein